MGTTQKRILFMIVSIGLFGLVGLTEHGSEIQRLVGCFSVGWVISDIANYLFKN